MQKYKPLAKDIEQKKKKNIDEIIVDKTPSADQNWFQIDISLGCNRVDE